MRPASAPVGCPASSLQRVSLPTTYSMAAARLAGLSRGCLRGSGFVRLGHDLFVRLDDAIDARERLRLLAAVLPPDAAFSHLTAAWLWGAPVQPPPRAHVALTPRRVLPQRAEFIVHSRLLREGDAVAHGGLRVTSGPQTFLDLAATLPPAELVAVGDALLRGGHLTATSLADRLARADRVRGVVRARMRTAPVGAGDVATGEPDAVLARSERAARAPPAGPVYDARGRVVAHGDLGYDRWRVLLEYEGRHHAETEQFDRDIDRYSLMAADGWLVLRFAHRQLNETLVLDRTRRALCSRGWRP